MLLNATDDMFIGCPRSITKTRKSKMLTSQRWSQRSRHRRQILEMIGDRDSSFLHSARDSRSHLSVAVTKPRSSRAAKEKALKRPRTNTKLLSKGHVHEPDEATAFRARSARGNYLTADRPDIWVFSQRTMSQSCTAKSDIISSSNDLQATYTIAGGCSMNTSGAILRSPPRPKLSKSTWIHVLQDADKPDAARVLVKSCTMATA